MSAAPARRSSARVGSWIVLALLLLFFAWMTIVASSRKSASFDEQYHLTAGFSYLKTGDYRLATTHPPLVGLIAALPLLADATIILPLDHPAWAQGNRFEFSDVFLWYANAEPASMLERARVPIVLLGLLLVLTVFLWGRSLYGAIGALLAALLVALDPNILANARQVTTDLGVTLALLLTFWRLWVWLARGHWWDVVLTGLCAGAAMAAKYNGLMLWPAMALVLILHPRSVSEGPAQRSGGRVVTFVAVAAIALIVVWAIYRFDVGAAQIGPFSIPAPALFYWTHLWQTLSGLVDENVSKPDFLLGQVSTGGWWYYFIVAMAVKTPIPTLILALAGVWAMARARLAREQAALWVPPLLFVAMALTGVLTIGYRHLLPALPFAGLLAGNSVRWLAGRRRRFAGAAIGLLVAWLALSTIRFFPNHDSYFNELAGGWPNWSRILVDSNLDWGQDLPALRQVMAERGIERVNLAYFGKAAPEAYGVQYDPLPGYLRYLNGRELNAYNPAAPGPGWYAVSATSLRLGNLQPGGLDLYEAFRDREPDARAGYSIYLYEVADDPGVEARPLVVTGEPAAGLPAESLAGEGWRSQVRWRGSEGTRIESAEMSGALPENYQALGADFGGVFTLEGFTTEAEVVRPGDTLRLNLYWRKGPQAMPMPAPIRGEPISAFVHVVDGQPDRVVAQFDGWETALRGLQEGDRIVQPVEITLPDDLAPALGLRVLAGLYSPQDGQRLTITGPGEAVGADGAVDAVELGTLEFQPRSD